jgi:hypothetical protein
MTKAMKFQRIGTPPLSSPPQFLYLIIHLPRRDERLAALA